MKFMQMMELAFSAKTALEIWPKPKLTAPKPKLSLLLVMVLKRNRKRNSVDL